MRIIVTNGNVDAAMRKVKAVMAEDLAYVKSKAFYVKPSTARREYKKKLRANWLKKQRKLQQRENRGY